MSQLLVEDLVVEFNSRGRRTRALDGLSLQLAAGETLGLVGESGCGKSTVALALMGLLPRNALVQAQRLECLGNNLLAMSRRQRRALCGPRLAMVFQDPMTSLNPYLPIETQLGEHIRLHQKLSKSEARSRVLELLELVEIPDPPARLRDYPHQFSGGQRQRLLIAMALACDPDVLIADEPTTALDVTVQAQILRLLKRLQQERQLALLLITHDMGVVAGMCDRVAVCYGGRIIEEAPVQHLFEGPRHPYTQGLLAAVPRLDQHQQALQAIPGMPPQLQGPRQGCAFAPRCPHANERCQQQIPINTLERHHWRCIRAEEADS